MTLGETAAGRRGRVPVRVVGVLAGLAAIADLRTGQGPHADAVVPWIGHAGGLLMIVFVALLVLRCTRELTGTRPAPDAVPAAPAATFTPAEKCAVGLGALVLQFAALYLAFLTTGHGFSAAAFWDAFQTRFGGYGDSEHYLYLAQYGYQDSGPKANLVVFYPLYPGLIWVFRSLFGGYVAAGLFISWACWAGACVSMLDLAARRFDRSRAALAALLLALYPFSFFAMGVYTESLFLLLTLQCLLRIDRGRWAAAGVLGCLAALCRTQGVLLVLPAAYVWLRARREHGPRGPAGAFLLLIPAGFGGYLLLNRIVAGDWTAFLGYQRAAPWYQTAKWISVNLMQHYDMAHNYPGLAVHIYAAQLVLYFVAIGLLLYGVHAHAPTYLLMYGGAYLGLSYLSGWLISGPRYVFGCVPLFLLAATPRHRAWQAVVPVAAALLFLCYCVFYMQGQSIL